MKQQVLKDRGGRIEFFGKSTIQSARVTIKDLGNANLATSIVDKAASVTSLSTTVNDTMAVAATTITLTSTTGIKPWTRYLVGPNTLGESEWVLIEEVTSSTVVKVADPAGLRHSYAAADLFQLPRVSYDISTDVAEAEALGTYRARWRLVIGENSATATGGSTSTIELDDADATTAYVGAPVVVALDSDTFYTEERTITGISSAGGTTTITVDEVFSEAVSTDAVYIDGSIRWEEQLFDIVYQRMNPTLTTADLEKRWPDLRLEQFKEQQGSGFEEQIRVAWEDMLDDIAAVSGKNPALWIGRADAWERPHAMGLFAALAERGLRPNLGSGVDALAYIDRAQSAYKKMLATAIKDPGNWYDEDEDLDADTTELGQGIRVAITR